MAVNPIQLNIDNTKSQKTYRDANKPVKTTKNIKPLHPEGHLVHDSFLTIPKYFLKDIAYDVKAVKDGLKGNANDHQLGRINDVGLKLGGVGIATMLAARTKNPLVRIMEYTGLAAFLTSMSLYPKLAINLPSRIVQGFDIGKEYIDDQGRKKSVFQDSNYIPFDMYQGDYPGEDLDVIGDRMGIPRDIEDRHDMIKEQMRKIATQNNTLWMMTAGVVPVMAGLICYGLERGISNGLEILRNAKFNSHNSVHDSSIHSLLKRTSNMTDDLTKITENSLSKEVNNILVNYKGKDLPNIELENLIRLFTKGMDANTSAGVKQDLDNIFTKSLSGGKNYAISEKLADEIVNDIKKNIPSKNKTLLEKVFVPSSSQVSDILSKIGSKEINDEQIMQLKGEFRRLFDENISKSTGVSKQSLTAQRNLILENISKKIKLSNVNKVTSETINDVVNFAKVIGDFKKNQLDLEKCKSFKVEYAPETVLAKAYGKFENTLIDVLDINYKDLKKIRESEKFTQELFDQRLEALAKDDNKYQAAVEKLTKVISDMEVKLNGSNSKEAHLKDLITGIENNYNNTAKRLGSIGKFKNTVDRLVKEDVQTLSNSLNSKKDLYDLLDGLNKNKFANLNYWKVDDAERIKYAKYNSKGVGSSKNLEISRIVERYQGVKNSFNRVLHLFDVYKRPIEGGEYEKSILDKGKKVLMSATSSDHTMKFDTINNPTYYRDIINTIWSDNLQKATEQGVSISKDMESGDVAGRLKSYIIRFKDIIGNNDIDFQKPQHVLNKKDLEKYTKSEKTRMAKFNLIAQNPTELLKNAAAKKYGNHKWLRTVSAIGASVFGVALLAQLGFGKIRNPQNIRKKVNEDANK